LQHSDLLDTVHHGLTLGKERLIVSPVVPAQPRKRTHMFRLGHTGKVQRRAFDRLSETKLSHEQQVDLLPGEVRQGFLQLSVPEHAKRGQLFAIDIRHEVKRPGHHGLQPIGGLIVMLKIH
jgi:hypothetical protein